MRQASLCDHFDARSDYHITFVDGKNYGSWLSAAMQDTWRKLTIKRNIVETCVTIDILPWKPRRYKNQETRTLTTPRTTINNQQYAFQDFS